VLRLKINKGLADWQVLVDKDVSLALLVVLSLLRPQRLRPELERMQWKLPEPVAKPK
jgi:hypothetical protein